MKPKPIIIEITPIARDTKFNGEKLTIIIKPPKSATAIPQIIKPAVKIVVNPLAIINT